MRSLRIGKARWLSLALALVGLLLGVAILACQAALAADTPTIPPEKLAQAIPTPTPVAMPMPIGADSCLLCHESPGLSMKFPSGEVLSINIDGAKMAAGVHSGKLQCVDCHTTITTFPHPKIVAKTKRQFQVAQYESCRGCHAEIYATYLDSVHGRALTLHNNPDVPLCGDCHGTHDQKTADSPSYRLNSPEMCATCHSNAAMMAEYGLSANVFKTYAQDFHGATVMVTQKESTPHAVEQAVCYDCHGAHNVKSFRTGDPALVRQEVVAACQKCHPDAGQSFPRAWLGHYELTLEKAPAAWLARAWYTAFIPFMVGGMAIHIGADLYGSRRRRKK